jgi:hypothetical protein
MGPDVHENDMGPAVSRKQYKTTVFESLYHHLNIIPRTTLSPDLLPPLPYSTLRFSKIILCPMDSIVTTTIFESAEDHDCPAPGTDMAGTRALHVQVEVAY